MRAASAIPMLRLLQLAPAGSIPLCEGPLGRGARFTRGGELGGYSGGPAQRRVGWDGRSRGVPEGHDGGGLLRGDGRAGRYWDPGDVDRSVPGVFPSDRVTADLDLGCLPAAGRRAGADLRGAR